jgi:hypothetical protein
LLIKIKVKSKIPLQESSLSRDARRDIKRCITLHGRLAENVLALFLEGLGLVLSVKNPTSLQSESKM